MCMGHLIVWKKRHNFVWDIYDYSQRKLRINFLAGDFIFLRTIGQKRLLILKTVVLENYPQLWVKVRKSPRRQCHNNTHNVIYLQVKMTLKYG